MKGHELKRASIVRDRKLGMTAKEVAEKHGVPLRYVYDYCPVNKRKKTGCPIDPADLKLMQELINDGIPIKRIHQKFDEYPFYVVRDWVRRSEDIISLPKLRQMMENEALPEGELTLTYKGKQLYRMVPI